MSTRWPGGIINGSAPVPTGGGAGDLAPGVWTIDQADQYIATQTWPGTGTPDPQFQYVTALLHGDGTNGGQNNTFLDSSSNNFTITRNGNTTQGSFSPYGDLWSNNFNGSSNLVTSSSQVIPSGSYTLEAWVFVTGTSATQTIFAQGTGTGDSARTFLGIEDNSGAKWAVQIGGTQAISTITPALNTWTHVAMTFNGSTMALYLNGTSIATASSSTNASNTTLQLGKNWGTYWFNGYISNARVSNTVRYTATFTPQTTPFVADANTVFLSCQANRFIDASTNNYALSVQNGSPSVQRFSPFQNLATYTPARVGGSGYFDGSGDSLSVANNTALEFGSGDFTIEAFVYFNSLAANRGIVYLGTDPNSNFSYGLQWAGNVLYFWYTTNGSNLTNKSASWTPVTSTWYHVAVTRSGNDLKFFIDGTQIGTTQSMSGVTIFDSTSAMLIGGESTGSPTSLPGSMNGYISSFRIVKGTAVYTANFTPPTAPLTAITNTSLLTNFTNGAIFDSDATNNLETVGNAQISTSVVKYGTGSMFLNGAGNRLVARANPPNSLAGTGSFTVEMWIYPTANAPIYDATLLSRGTITGTGNYSFYLTGSGTLNRPSIADLNSPILNSSTAVPLNTWSHVAFVRLGATSWYIFINGLLTASTTASRTFTDNANDLVYIGASSYDPPTADRSYTGYIDDLRITNGYARYWYNFPAPTAPFPNYGGVLAPPVQDPLFAYNTLLLNGDGTNGAQNNTFLDSSTNNFTITRNGNTTQGSFSPYGSLWSNYFGAGNTSISTPSTSNLQLGSSDFTVEGWVYNNSFGSSGSFIMGKWNYPNKSYYLGYNASNLYFGVSTDGFNDTAQLNASVSLAVNTWYHIAAVRSGNTLYFYVNGTQVGTASCNFTFYSGSAPLLTGGMEGGGTAWQTFGYISNARLVIGTAVYTAAFTPSTTPLTAITNTRFLTSQSNRFIDNSTNNAVISVYSGAPSVQRFSPFNPTASYSTSVIGGSGYFDGNSTTRLQTPSNSAVSAWSTDFCIESWIFLNTFDPIATVLWTNSTSNSDGMTAGYLYPDGTIGMGRVGVNEFTSGAGVVRNNTWTHIAFVRNGSTVTIYVNGVSVATGATSNLETSTTKPITLGNGFQSVNTIFTGYISNFRVVKGSPVYTSNFTPPTAPLTAITNTSLLLNTINAGIPDLAMQTNLETVGNAQVSTSVVKYGTGSLAFDGSGDYLSIPSSALFNQSGNFTIEYWAYWASNTNYQIVVGRGSGFITIQHSSDSGAMIRIVRYGAALIATGGNVTAGQWNHFALVRSGSTVTAYLNGNPVASGTDSTATAPANILAIGENGDGSNYLNGYIDDLRITNGIARYVQPFTPPTAALQTF